MKPTTKRLISLGVVVGLGFAASACSATLGETIDEAAVKLIEGDIADQMGQGPLEGECDALESDAEIGSTFSCTGTTEDGTVLPFTAEKTGEREVFVSAG